MTVCEPHLHERRILLAATGLSPQVVTETLYALAVRQSQPFVPTEIHIITTGEGAERAELALLSDNPGWFFKFKKDFSLPEITFGKKNIHIITDDSGKNLVDIRTPEDNRLVADSVTEIVRELTLDPNSALHVSIAGGRKTMGFYLGYALSLYGRTQDRLSHVLVSEPFESSWDFFYPTPYSRVVTARDNKLVDTKTAVVTLAEIPFVSLRHGLDQRLLQGKVQFSSVVAAARRGIAPPSLQIDLTNQCVNAAGEIISLPPKSLAMLSLFARRAMSNKLALPAPSKEVPDQAWAERYLREYRAIRSGKLDDLDRTESALKKGMDGDYFSECKSKLHRELKKQLGIAAKPYLIDDSDCRPRQYALILPPEAISYSAVHDDKLADEYRDAFSE